MSREEYEKVGKVLTEGLNGDEIDTVTLVEEREEVRLLIILKSGGRYVLTADFDIRDNEGYLCYRYERE
ncbi:hypothetical protein P9578_28250 [Brevibacillus choshinensis]|uniref:hypothetical protein n=1 Tax=Brevibacillus choshinensis TaxID=54911 RepID=UPI002E1C9A2F|nr:hypothetical protein [Brevibacillus choshinensis]